MYRRFGKRILDVVVSAVLLVALSPLLLLVCLLLALTNRGNVFFVQPRPGCGERIFKIYKFKTMTDDRGPDGELLPDNERITTVGRIVRKLSLDELLQLVNVLLGDMSLVGPRPLLPEYLPRYNAHQRRRHEVLPGITGLAQVKGRNDLNWQMRFRYDVFYVDHMSLRFDLLILWWTACKVLAMKGTGGDNGKFLGNERPNIVMHELSL